MATLTRADLRARLAARLAQPAATEVHDLEGIGPVTVRGMTAKERDRVVNVARITRGRQKGDIDSVRFRHEVLLICILDEKGDPLFEVPDLESLETCTPGVVDGLLAVVNRLSGFGEKETDLLKNDSASPAATAGSASSSPSN